MKIVKIFAVGTTAILFSSSAMAQSFTYDVVWQPIETVGGMSAPDGSRGGGGAVVDGAYTTTYADGSEQKGKVRCVGMQQPDNSLFPIHMSCTATDPSGDASLVYGCNYLGQPGPETPLGCVGGLQGTTGDTAGRRGSLTMEWYSATQSRGTGQWYGGE